MEPAKKKTEDKNTNEILNHIFQNAFGNPIIFDSEPTNDGMKSNSWGFHNNNLFVKNADGVTTKFEGTNVD